MQRESNVYKSEKRLCGENYISPDRRKRFNRISDHNKVIAYENSWLCREMTNLNYEEKKKILKTCFNNRVPFEPIKKGLH
jgi:hypothetical protein